MIDCTWGSGNNGCRGGMPTKALEWVTKNGVATKKSYGPYLGQVSPDSIGYLISMSHKSKYLDKKHYMYINVVCCVGRVEIQIEIQKGQCTAKTDSMV